MSIPVGPGDTVVFVGDSITDQGCFGPAIDAINLLLTPRLSGAADMPRGGRADMARGSSRAIAASVAAQPIHAIISGVPGNTVEDIASNVSGRITDYNPDAVVMFAGVNDGNLEPLRGIRSPIANRAPVQLSFDPFNADAPVFSVALPLYAILFGTCLPITAMMVPVERSIRFRTLGCYPLTGAIESGADTLEAIVMEMFTARTSERQGRLIDGDEKASMEKKKKEGYF